MFHEARRTVSRDGHLEVDKAYYSAPPEYVGRRCGFAGTRGWCASSTTAGSRLLFTASANQAAFAPMRLTSPKKRSRQSNGEPMHCLRQIATIGPHTKAWSEATTQPSAASKAVRVLVGLKALAGKHETAALEEACQTALGSRRPSTEEYPQLLKRCRCSRTTALRVHRRAPDHPSVVGLLTRFPQRI